jgi:hypothetical protein
LTVNPTGDNISLSSIVVQSVPIKA